MTTIATDGKSMAADGLVTSADIVFNASKTKVRRLKDGSLAGGAGDSPQIRKALAWLEGEGARPKLRNTRLLVLRPSGRVDLVEGDEGLTEVEAPVAIGSGGDVAIGAMEAGKTAKEAVEIAAKRDPFTGGTITEKSL